MPDGEYHRSVPTGHNGTVWCRYYQDVCLLEQPYVMDDSQRVQDVIKVCGVQVFEEHWLEHDVSSCERAECSYVHNGCFQCCPMWLAEV